VVLVENASRFARDLAVQLTGHALLRARGIELVPVDAPTYFTDPSPTAEMVRQILGAVSQFEKAGPRRACAIACEQSPQSWPRSGILLRRGSLTTPAASATCWRPERALASASGGNFAEHIVPPTGPD